MTYREAKLRRQQIEQSSENQTDEQAKDAKWMHPIWDASTVYAEGKRVRDPEDGELYKRIQPQIVPEVTLPHEVPALWLHVGDTLYREIKENMLATEAFHYEEIGWWQEKTNLYRSKMEGNAYTPVTAPAVWEKIEQ